MELRWLIKRNIKITKEDVLAYREAHSTTLQEAKRILQNEKTAVLQWRSTNFVEWCDVPTVVVDSPLS